MDNTLRVQTEAAARLLLQDYRDAHPDWMDDETPIDALAAWLDLHVATFYPDDYAQGTYGFVDPDEDERLIWLRRDLPEPLRRFTLAHELGHVILHCQSGQCCDGDVQVDLLGEMYDDRAEPDRAYDPRSQRELVANFFAAELLLPFERVRTLYLEKRVSPDLLANSFGVSSAALLNRLAGLLANHVQSDDRPREMHSRSKTIYDEFQQNAIHAATPALILAGPGSGKTSTLIGRIQHMLQEEIPPEHILALTFSRKAAREMEARLQKIIDKDESHQIPKISTFHAFCAEILRHYAHLVGLPPDFRLLDEAEGYLLLRDVTSKLHLHYYIQLQYPTHYLPDILKAISRAKDELISPNAYLSLAQTLHKKAEQREDKTKDASPDLSMNQAREEAEKVLEIAQIYQLYEQELQRRGNCDFGGLLILALRLFHEHPDILYHQQEKYQYILVDEYQDMNRASSVLLRELAGKQQRVWVVGDANQAIYTFRGASPANIRQFAHDFPGASILILNCNYRSLPDIVTIAESFRHHELAADQPEFSLSSDSAIESDPILRQSLYHHRARHSEASITLAHAADEASEIAGIIEDIRLKLANGYFSKDIAILCRRRAQVQKISQQLAQAGLPVIEQTNILEQQQSKDLLSILLLLADSRGMGLLRAACLPEHQLGQQDVEALLLTARTSGFHLTPDVISEEGRPALLRLAQILQNLQHSPDIWSMLARYLFIETTMMQYLLTSPEDKQFHRMLANYQGLLQIARHFDQQYESQIRFSENNEEIQKDTAMGGNRARIKQFLEYLSLLVLLHQDGSNNEQHKEQEDVIRVMTVHASKGLEFPIVYLPELVQQRFPFRTMPNPMPQLAISKGDKHNINAIESKTDIILNKETMKKTDTIELGQNITMNQMGEACLFYVGITRARDQLILSYSDCYGKKNYKRSSYLDSIEAALPSERLNKLHWTTVTSQDSRPVPQEQFEDSDVRTSAQLSCPQRWSGPSEEFLHAAKPAMLDSSAIEAYQRCPQQYAYNTIYHFAAAPDGYQLFKIAVRNATAELYQHYQDNNINNNLPTQEEIQDIYLRHWQDVGGSTTHFANFYQQHGDEVVEAIRCHLAEQKEPNWDLARNFPIEIAGTTIQVTIDRVETAGETNPAPVKFVRTRFGKNKEKSSAETRELLYALASRHHYPEQLTELHSHNMSTSKITPMKLSEKKAQSLYESIAQAINGLQQNSYPAQPAQPTRCPTCPFFWICPR